jgi:peptidoglycan/LPS O-acetylase OafA/YrhL
MSDAAPSPSRLAYLDGLRGLCCLVILLSHNLSAWLPSLAFGVADRRVPYLSRWAHTPAAIIWSGDTAVMVFFVVSGFVLARSWVWQTGSGDSGLHIAKRTIRLGVPVGCAVLFAGAVFHAGLMRNQQAALVSQSNWLGSFYLPGPRPGLLWTAAGGSLISGADWWMGPLWSAHVQLFGWLLVFALTALVGKDRRSTLAFGLVIAWSLAAGSSRFGLHFAAFVGGALMYRIWQRRIDEQGPVGQSKVIRAFNVLVIVYFGSWPDEELVGRWYEPIANLFSFTDNYLRPRSLAHTAAGLAIVWLTLTSPTLQRWFRFGIFQQVGRISFAIYLTHWPVLMSLGAFSFAKVAASSSSLFLGAVVASISMLIGTLAVSIVFSKLTSKLTGWVTTKVGAVWESIPERSGVIQLAPSQLSLDEVAVSSPPAF